MLEKILAALTELASAVKELTANIKSGGGQTKTPDASPKPEEKAPKKDTKADTSTELKGIQEQGMKLIKSGKQEAVKAVLKEFGASTFTQLKPDTLTKVKERLEALESEEVDNTARTSEAPAMSVDDVKKLAAPLLAKDGDKPKFPKAVEAIKALLKKFGAPKVSEVPADKLAAFAKALAEIKPDEAGSDDLV